MGILEKMADAGIGDLIAGVASTAGPVYARDRKRLADAEARRQERLSYKTDSVEQLLTTARNVQPDLTTEQEEQITNRLVALPQADLDDLVQFGLRGGQALTFTQVQPDQQVKGIPIGGGFAVTIADTSATEPTKSESELSAFIEFSSLGTDTEKLATWFRKNPIKAELAKTFYYREGNRHNIKVTTLKNAGLIEPTDPIVEGQPYVGGYRITEEGAQALAKDYGGIYSKLIDSESGDININKLRNLRDSQGKIINHFVNLIQSETSEILLFQLMQSQKKGSLQAENILDEARKNYNKNETALDDGQKNQLEVPTSSLPTPAGKLPSDLLATMQQNYNAAALQKAGLKLTQFAKGKSHITLNNSEQDLINLYTNNIIAQSNGAWNKYKADIIEMLELSFSQLKKLEEDNA
jgi:DNA-binding PadR family transcriptional regulator